MTKKLTFEEFKELFPKTYDKGFNNHKWDILKINDKSYSIYSITSLITGKTHYSHDSHFFRADLGSEEQLEEIYKDFYYKFSQEGK